MDERRDRRKRSMNEHPSAIPGVSGAKRVATSDGAITPALTLVEDLLKADSAGLQRMISRFTDLICNDSETAWKETVVIIASMCGVPKAEIRDFYQRNVQEVEGLCPEAVVAFICEKALPTSGCMHAYDTNPELADDWSRTWYPLVKYFTLSIGQEGGASYRAIFGNEAGQDNGKFCVSLTDVLLGLSDFGRAAPTLRAYSALLSAPLARVFGDILEGLNAETTAGHRQQHAGQTFQSQATAASTSSTGPPSSAATSTGQGPENARIRQNVVCIFEKLYGSLAQRIIEEDQTIILRWMLKGLEKCIDMHGSYVVPLGIIEKLAQTAVQNQCMENKRRAAKTLRETLGQLTSSEKGALIKSWSPCLAGCVFQAISIVERDDEGDLVAHFLDVIQAFNQCCRVDEFQDLVTSAMHESRLEKTAFPKTLLALAKVKGVGDDAAFVKVVVDAFVDLRSETKSGGNCWDMAAGFCHAVLLFGGERRRLSDWRRFYDELMSASREERLSKDEAIALANLFKAAAVFAIGGELKREAGMAQQSDERRQKLTLNFCPRKFMADDQLRAQRRSFLKFMVASACPNVQSAKFPEGSATHVRRCFEDVFAYEQLFVSSDWSRQLSEQDEAMQILSDLLELLFVRASRVAAGPQDWLPLEYFLARIRPWKDHGRFPNPRDEWPVLKRLGEILHALSADGMARMEERKKVVESAVDQWKQPKLNTGSRNKLNKSVRSSAAFFSTILRVITVAVEHEFLGQGVEIIAGLEMMNLFQDLNAWLQKYINQELVRVHMWKAVVLVVRVQETLICRFLALTGNVAADADSDMDWLLGCLPNAINFRRWCRVMLGHARMQARDDQPRTSWAGHLPNELRDSHNYLPEAINCIMMALITTSAISYKKVRDAFLTEAINKEREESRQLVNHFFKKSLRECSPDQLGKLDAKLLLCWTKDLMEHSPSTADYLGEVYLHLDKMHSNGLLMGLWLQEVNQLKILADACRMHAEAVVYAIRRLADVHFALDTLTNSDCHHRADVEAMVHRKIRRLLIGEYFPRDLMQPSACAVQEFLITCLKDILQGKEFVIRRATVDHNQEGNETGSDWLPASPRQKMVLGLFTVLKCQFLMITGAEAEVLLSALDREFPEETFKMGSRRDRQSFRPLLDYRKALVTIAGVSRS